MTGFDSLGAAFANKWREPEFRNATYAFKCFHRIPIRAGDATNQYRAATPSLILDEGFQSTQRVLPLVGDAVEIRLELFEGLQPELEQIPAAGANAAHDAGTFEQAQMLGDRLAGEPRTVGEPRDRLRRSFRQLADERWSRLVAQCREDRRDP